ncbi:hypothetical protein FDECE_9659 [Fusarium decemcellulare]|nr:hypothetical protein FDECE_9659 [Fusarium decemcellulare]
MSLPLKAKVSIRDNWTKPDCPAQKAIKNLKEVLGLQIYCEPEWPILVSELGNVWEDKSQLVASVVSFLQTWFQTLTELLEDSTQEEWADILLNKINELCSRLNLIVEVSETQKASTKTTPSIPIHSTTGDEWADVRAEDVSEKSVKQRPAKSEAPVIEYLPDPNTMPKPGTLLQRVPYHLFVYSSGKNNIEIECSHSQTLEVLSEYLKRWCRINPNITTKPPAVDIELNHGTSGFGVVYDRLTLFCENRYGGIFTVSPTMILNLVEGVFGYERLTLRNDGAIWRNLVQTGEDN